MIFVVFVNNSSSKGPKKTILKGKLSFYYPPGHVLSLVKITFINVKITFNHAFLNLMI